MRPNVDIPESNQYECTSCGTRVEATGDTRQCECGGSLRSLANSRDL